MNCYYNEFYLCARQIHAVSIPTYMLHTNKAKLYQCSGSPLPFHECSSIIKCMGLGQDVLHFESTHKNFFMHKIFYVFGNLYMC